MKQKKDKTFQRTLPTYTSSAIQKEGMHFNYVINTFESVLKKVS